MPTKRINYSEGDCFAVPLTRGGYALGVVARMDGRGGVVSYLFGPRVEALPTPDDLRHLTPARAVAVRQIADLRLIQGQWPLIGKHPGWDRDRWPIPAFQRIEELTGRAFRVEYTDDDLNQPLREASINPEEARTLPPNGVLGALAVERLLSELLTPANRYD